MTEQEVTNPNHCQTIQTSITRRLLEAKSSTKEERQTTEIELQKIFVAIVPRGFATIIDWLLHSIFLFFSFFFYTFDF